MKRNSMNRPIDNIYINITRLINIVRKKKNPIVIHKDAST